MKPYGTSITRIADVKALLNQWPGRLLTAAFAGVREPTKNTLFPIQPPRTTNLEPKHSCVSVRRPPADAASFLIQERRVGREMPYSLFLLPRVCLQERQIPSGRERRMTALLRRTSQRNWRPNRFSVRQEKRQTLRHRVLASSRMERAINM